MLYPLGHLSGIRFLSLVQGQCSFFCLHSVNYFCALCSLKNSKFKKPIYVQKNKDIFDIENCRLNTEISIKAPKANDFISSKTNTNIIENKVPVSIKKVAVVSYFMEKNTKNLRITTCDLFHKIKNSSY